MNLEFGNVYCEEIGQQLLSYNKQKSAEELAAEIDSLTKEDVMKSIQEMLKFPISYSVFGGNVKKEINSIPPVQNVLNYLRLPYK